MKLTIKQFITLSAKAILSLFGTGYIKFAPGTFGSIASIPAVYYLFQSHLSISLKITIIALITCISIALAQFIQSRENLKDPQWIVIDELIGMLVASLALKNVNAINLLILLIIFRFFDIFKIWPATYFDSLKHGAGTILDDVISGIYSYIVLLIIGNYFL